MSNTALITMSIVSLSEDNYNIEGKVISNTEEFKKDFGISPLTSGYFDYLNYGRPENYRHTKFNGLLRELVMDYRKNLTCENSVEDFFKTAVMNKGLVLKTLVNHGECSIISIHREQVLGLGNLDRPLYRFSIEHNSYEYEREDFIINYDEDEVVSLFFNLVSSLDLKLGHHELRKLFVQKLNELLMCLE